ncbi:hypothetical protein ACW9HH_36425 [Nocardia gipuzkoensis]
MANNPVAHLHLTSVVRDSLPTELHGVKLDTSEGIPLGASASGGVVEMRESGWIVVRAIPHDAQPDNWRAWVEFTFPPTAVAAIVKAKRAGV